MEIEGIGGLSMTELEQAMRRGGRFVFFESCISLGIGTLRRATPILFLRHDQAGWVRGLPYTVLSMMLGWWGLPWGPIYTPIVVAANLAGGYDVTEDVCQTLGLDVRGT